MACTLTGKYCETVAGTHQRDRHASERGVILIASSPARGEAVYQAAYENVIRVSGDARCQSGEFSALFNRQADFSAHAWPLGKTPEGVPLIGGASYAAAEVTIAVARYLSEHDDVSGFDPVEYLRTLCRYSGRERRKKWQIEVSEMILAKTDCREFHQVDND